MRSQICENCCKYMRAIASVDIYSRPGLSISVLPVVTKIEEKYVHGLLYDYLNDSLLIVLHMFKNSCKLNL